MGLGGKWNDGYEHMMVSMLASFRNSSRCLLNDSLELSGNLSPFVGCQW